MTCLLARERGGVRLRSQLLVYPGTDGGDLSRASVEEFAEGPFLTRAGMIWFRGHYNGGTEDRSDIRAVPANAPDHAGLPPAFVVTAEVDPLRDSGEHYAGVLARSGF